MKASIPEYADHVIKTWDAEWISKELLANMPKWMEVTRRWNEMSALRTGVLQACEACEFDVAAHYPEDVQTSETALQMCKDFIGVVQTCALIVETLPTL
eukprot:9798273-Lingulodinium_polyedra.AAC.1